MKSLKTDNDTITNEPIVISNSLNNYFCKVGRELYSKIPHNEPTYSSLIDFNSHTCALFPVSSDEVADIISKLKPNGNLNSILPSNQIKPCTDILTEPLTKIINKCFINGSFPIELKTSRIVPIFKSGDSLLPINYRPVNILEDLSKIIEMCTYNRIFSFCKRFKLIHKNQFGFQRQSGTLSAAICLIDDIRRSIDMSNSNICACIFLDVTKAFESIPHDMLMSKLYRYGFRGKIGDFIRDFLSNRQQYVFLSNTSSQHSSVDFGTPQGSTLGPILFLLYMNDICNLKLNGKIILFADDAVLIYTSNNNNE